MSNSTNLIEATKAGKDGIQVVFNDLCRKMLERSIRVAESQNEFEAGTILVDFLEASGLSKSKASNLVAPVDGKAATITREASVSERLWSMILRKVDKIGSITECKGNTAKLILKKGKEAEAFLKSVATIKGIKLS